VVKYKENNFLGDVGYVGIAEFVNRGCMFLLIPIITKFLGAEAYGTWALVIVIITLLLPVSSIGFELALPRFLPTYGTKESTSNAFFSSLLFVLLVSSVVGALIYSLSPFVSSLILNDSELDIIVVIAAFLLPVWAVNIIVLNFFRNLNRMKEYSILSTSQNITSVLFVAYVLFLGWGIIEALIGFMLVRLIFTILLSILIGYLVGFPRIESRWIKQYIKFGFPLIFSKSSSYIIRLSDRLMINYYLGLAPVGIYSATFGIVQSLELFISVIIFVTLPKISRMGIKNKNKIKLYLESAYNMLLIFLIPASVLVIVFGSDILQYTTREEFVTQGKHLIPFMVLSMISYSLSNLYNQFLLLKKKTTAIAKIWLFAGSLNIMLNIVLIPKIGLVGAAMATLFSYLVVSSVIIIYSRKYFKFSFSYPLAVKSLASALMMVLVIKILEKIIHIDIFLIITGIVIYPIFLLSLYGFNKQKLLEIISS
jgi:O-antigen/teichoic acid export membrane protein